MTQRQSNTLFAACLMTVASAGIFAGCANDDAPDQARDVQPLGSIVVCETTAATLCAGAADPAACLAGLVAICPDVISTDAATCEAKFAAACASFGLPQDICDAAAVNVCTTFTTPGVCYDDTYNACISLGGADVLCNDVATALCSNPGAVTCDQFVDKLCAAIPLSQGDCDAAHQGLCSSGGLNPNPGSVTPVPPAGGCDASTVVNACTPVDCPAWVQSMCDAAQPPVADAECAQRIAQICT
ncbi:MAG: hypothetical protein IPL79_13885 [Myxococcales bacterium]|nr:hypothetical protein [Myxococcales bacterium]